MVFFLVPLMLSANSPENIKKELVLSQLITLEQTVYQGHDDGESCNSDIAQPNITIIDEERDRKEQITFCVKITNNSQAWLSQPLLKGIKPELIHTDFLPLESTTAKLAPNDSLHFYYEHLLEETLLSQLEVEANVVDKSLEEGDKHIRLSPTVKAVSQSKAELIYEPPTVHKTVLPRGGKGMLWQLILVNSNDTQGNAVELSDALPDNTVLEAMPEGDYISDSGIYCQAEGSSVTQKCEVESASTQYPNGRIVWQGLIAPDLANSTTEEASNKVTIRFQSKAEDAEVGDIISSQAHSYWGLDKKEILSDNPATNAKADPTLFTIHKSIEYKKVMEIPSLSQWGLLLLSLILLLVARARLS